MFPVFRDLDKHESEVIVELKNGATQITLPERPFMHGTHQRSAIIGKLFMIRLLEVRHKFERTKFEKTNFELTNFEVRPKFLNRYRPSYNLLT